MDVPCALCSSVRFSTGSVAPRPSGTQGSTFLERGGGGGGCGFGFGGEGSCSLLYFGV